MSREQTSRFKKKTTTTNCKNYFSFQYWIKWITSRVVRLTGIGVFERVESVESVLMNMATANEYGTRRRLFFFYLRLRTQRGFLYPPWFVDLFLNMHWLFFIIIWEQTFLHFFFSFYHRTRTRDFHLLLQAAG